MFNIRSLIFLLVFSIGFLIVACDSVTNHETELENIQQAEVPQASAGHVTPSTNDENKDKGWAHFEVLDVGIGFADIKFVSTRDFLSCFEYRSDGEATPYEDENFNEDIEDGLWPFVCVNNSTEVLNLEANEYVEIRMVFGAETDERFDWTRVDVLPAQDAQTRNDCMNGGWEDFGFKNQGQCVRYVNTGKDSR